MGIHSEVAAERNATALKKILNAAKKTKNKEVVDFCRKHLFPWYQSELGEAWLKEEDLAFDKFWRAID